MNPWAAVATSADGNFLCAVAGNESQPGGIFTLSNFPTVASGGAGDVATLQYVGNGVWQANSMNAARLTGTIALTNLPAGLVTNNQSGVVLNGTFSGNGSGLTSLTAANLTGTVSLNQLAGITGSQLAASVWQAATNLNGGNAALASNVVAGLSITNAFITNSVFAGNGGGLTNLNAAKLTGRISAVTNFPVTLVTNLLNSPGSLPLSNSFISHGGTLVIFTSGSGTIGSVTAMGMTIALDGTIIETNKIWCNVASAHMAFVPKTTVKNGVAAGSHTITLSSWNSTTTDANDSFNVTVQELPY